MTDAASAIRFPSTLIRASAGSGKTFQLSSRYLALAAAGASPGRILATTFTRAAAGEIRDRILRRLVDAAENPTKRTELARSIGAADLARADVLRQLRALVRDLHVMQVRTLDSFFASVARSFALELGMPGDGRVVEGAEELVLRREAIGRVLAESGGSRLIEILRLLTRGATRRSVTEEIDGTVGDLYEISRQSAPEAWAWLPAEAEAGPAAVEQSIRAIEGVAVEGKRFANARDGDVAAARVADWPALAGKGLAGVLMRGEHRYWKQDIPAALVEAYAPLVAHARAVLVNRLRDQTQATRELLDLFHVQYEWAKRQAHVSTFADLTTAMTRVNDLGSLDEAFFRMDAMIRHLLLDEFQDTSVGQWRGIEPIARVFANDGTGSRSLFCVGDAKQSIYGWRGGCPKVLDEIERLATGPDGTNAVSCETLSASYRSSPVVIDVVNRVFEHLTDNPVFAAHPGTATAAADFARDFERHDTVKDHLPGYTELRTVAWAPTSQERVRLRIAAAAALVGTLHRRTPATTIGVLTRTNAAVARLLFELAPGRGDVPASGRGGGPLTDAPAVLAVLDLLRLADHPADSVAAFHVARSPLGPLVGLGAGADAAARVRLARSVRRRLLDDGYARTIAAWADEIESACDERERRRLGHLVALAETYDARPTLRAMDFVRTVEQQDVADSVPAPVQVMTIHRAKGLEFDVVVLPELEGKLTGSSQPTVVFERDGHVGPIRRVFRWVNQKQRDLMPAVEQMTEAALTRTAQESLCLLYVAMTRAKQGLFMLIDPPKPAARGTDPPPTAAGVLRGALADVEPPAPDAVIFAAGEQDALGAVPAADAPAPGAGGDEPLVIRLAPRAESAHRARAARPASAGKGTLGQVLPLGDDSGLERGRALHHLFERVEWLEDWRAGDAALVGIVRQTAPRRDEAWAAEIVASFRAALARPDVRVALSRGRADPDSVEVWRERRYARRVGEGPEAAIEEGAIDRLVVHHGAGGGVERAKVIDFKTDRVSAADAPAHAEGYRRQLETYRAAAGRLLDLDESACSMTVLFVEPGVGVEL